MLDKLTNNAANSGSKPEYAIITSMHMELHRMLVLSKDRTHTAGKAMEFCFPRQLRQLGGGSADKLQKISEPVGECKK